MVSACAISFQSRALLASGRSCPAKRARSITSSTHPSDLSGALPTILSPGSPPCQTVRTPPVCTRSHANSSSGRAPDGSTAQRRRRGTPSGAPTIAVATSPAGPAGQAYHGERTRKRSDQRRRRPHDTRGDLADARAVGHPPRAPRPRRAARVSETPLPSAFRSGISDCLPRGQASPAAGTGASSSFEKDAEGTTGAGRSKSSRTVAPSRGSSGRGPEAESRPRPSSTSLLSSTVEDDEEREEKEDFPALPPAGGHRIAPLVRSSPSSHPLPPPPPPLEASAAGASSALDYSSLTDRLAAEAAAAEAAKSAGPGSGPPGENFLHLSVLPGFGYRPGDKSTLRGNNSGSAEFPDSHSQVVQTPAPRPTGAGDGGEVSLRTFSSTPLRPPSPPRRPTLAASTANKRRVGAAAATVALRARLRERWFRLEAVRKAQRQREAAERGHMAAEDNKPTDRRHHEDGQGRQGGHTGEESHGVEASQRLKSRAQGSDSVDDCSSSCDSSDSGGGGGGGDGGNEGAGDIDTAAEERSNSVCLSLASPTTPPERSTTAASVGCGPERYDPRKSSVSDARIFSGSSGAPRAISVAGIAAIRRSELAAAASVHQSSVPTENIATRPGTPVEATIGDITGSASLHDKLSEAGGGLLEREASGYGSSGSCGGSDGPSAPGERAHAACEAGMAGLLNDILVRSGGRAADGKDKVLIGGGADVIICCLP